MVSVRLVLLTRNKSIPSHL